VPVCAKTGFCVLYAIFPEKKNGELREFDLNGEKVNYQYFQEIHHQTQQQISRGVKESHCDSFYNNNIRYLYFSDLIISASSSFFSKRACGSSFSTASLRTSVPESICEDRNLCSELKGAFSSTITSTYLNI
jgi:hypothetical protein